MRFFCEGHSASGHAITSRPFLEITIRENPVSIWRGAELDCYATECHAVNCLRIQYLPLVVEITLFQSLPKIHDHRLKECYRKYEKHM